MNVRLMIKVNGTVTVFVTKSVTFSITTTTDTKVMLKAMVNGNGIIRIP